MKKLLILCTILLLTGCDKSTEDITSRFIMSGDFADCKVGRLDSGGGKVLFAIRCPHSDTSTTFSSGKSSRTVVVIDGVEYHKAEIASGNTSSAMIAPAPPRTTVINGIEYQLTPIGDQP